MLVQKVTLEGGRKIQLIQPFQSVFAHRLADDSPAQIRQRQRLSCGSKTNG